MNVITAPHRNIQLSGLKLCRPLVMLMFLVSSVAALEPSPKALNQHDVIPILLRHCTTCHGLRRQEGGLDLRTKAAMLAGGESGPAMVPGKPGESLLVARIRSGQMPPNMRLFEVGVTPVADADLEKLQQWILQGAPEQDVAADAPGRESDPLVSDQDRQFWAFRPPQPVSPPIVKNESQVANPIDAFVLRTLEQRGLSLSPPASRLTLIRRAFFDLTGMPPEPEQVQSFVTDSDPHAYQQLIDSLLESPRYGERWGRYWLDLAGYCDHEGGKVNANGPKRAHAWRYRDYVIRSFNSDKPYDRFLLEQIAGDELADHEKVPVITEEMMDNLVATGFLRMGPDSTGFELSFVEDRFDVIADEIEIFGSGILGMTLQCARCHNHKFDPIPQRDYYRLVDVFKGALDEFDWLVGTPVEEIVKFEQRVLPYVKPRTNPLRWLDENKQREAKNDRLTQTISELEAALEGKAEPLKAILQEQRLAQLPAHLRQEIREMLKTASENHSPRQKELAREFGNFLAVKPGELKELDADYRQEAERTEREIVWLRYEQRDIPHIRALWDRGSPAPTYVLHRGDHNRPGRLVGPGVPSVLTDGKTSFNVSPPWPGATKTGRRLALAKWLVQSDNPLTARVMVNRIWRHHFGSGIVKTVGNFGQSGTRPTHPELLDWLALEFVERGWSFKAMHRLMMNSRTYRQASRVTPQHQIFDADNRLLSRWSLTRMDGEALHDSLLLVSHRLDERRFGPSDPVLLRPDGMSIAYPRDGIWRRAIYLRQFRFGNPTTLDMFDFPQMNPNCLDRPESTVAPQALHLLNDSVIRSLASSMAERVAEEAGEKPQDQIERAYWISLSRRPTEEELEISERSLEKAVADMPGAPVDHHQVLATFCHTLLNSAAFIYID